jgi:hypothetical protein
MTNPRWWTRPYLDAFDALQDRLAARYDGDPAIGQNVMCGPTGEFCEPFLRHAADSGDAPTETVAPQGKCCYFLVEVGNDASTSRTSLPTVR